MATVCPKAIVGCGEFTNRTARERCGARCLPHPTGYLLRLTVFYNGKKGVNVGLLQELRDWLLVSENRNALGFIGGGLATVIAGLWAVYVHFSKNKEEKKHTEKKSTSVLASKGSIAAGRDVNVTISHPIDVKFIIEKLEAAHHSEIKTLKQELDDWKAEASKAITALAEARGKPYAPPGINEALSALVRGDTTVAEAL